MDPRRKRRSGEVSILPYGNENPARENTTPRTAPKAKASPSKAPLKRGMSVYKLPKSKPRSRPSAAPKRGARPRYGGQRAV